MSNNSFGWGARQPWRGVVATIVGLVLACGITLCYGMDTYMGIFTLWMMSVVPIEIIIAMGWNSEFPPTGRMRQPFKGLTLLAWMFVVGSLIHLVVKYVVGGGSYHPLTHIYAIAVVILIFWAVIGFQMWPLNKLRTPWNGIGTLVMTYVIMWVGYRLFNFASLAYPTGENPSPIGAVPFYSEGGPFAGLASLVPSGPFSWEAAIACWFWSVMFLFIFASMNMWPFNKVPRLMKQPILGLVLAVSCAVLTAISYAIAVVGMKVEPLHFMISGISFLFGLLMVMLAFQLWPGIKWKMPGGGGLNIAIAVVIAIAAYYGLKAFCSWHFGAEAFVYPNNIFSMANMMLGLTFPAWALYGSFFEFWPLPKPPKPTP